MNVLVVGSGGREHALAWKISHSSRADRVFVAPGNAGTAVDAENVEISATDIPQLLEFAKQNDVGLTVVGPEAPLAAGIVDAFQSEKLRVFGPTKAAAELEASKVFCKNLLAQCRHSHGGLPSLSFGRNRDVDTSRDRYQTDTEDVPVVVKADGLAAGKGVLSYVTTSPRHCKRSKRVFGEFGDAAAQVVIEERLDGQEASIIAITDGQTILTMSPAQDHKPAYDGDKGPNTGGMGAYCPAPIVDDKTMEFVHEQVLVPTVHALKRSRNPFSGVLYAGLIMTNQGPKVLEYNVRFGDPECQPLLMRMRSDLLDIIEATVDGRLNEIDAVDWDPRPSVCVVMASEGYPGSYEKGYPIRGLDEAAELEDVKVFHAGTTAHKGKVINTGGRVLGVTALGKSISAAKLQAYTAVKCIRWEGAWCRKDISDKAIG